MVDLHIPVGVSDFEKNGYISTLHCFCLLKMWMDLPFPVPATCWCIPFLIYTSSTLSSPVSRIFFRKTGLNKISNITGNIWVNNFYMECSFFILFPSFEIVLYIPLSVELQNFDMSNSCSSSFLLKFFSFIRALL